MAKHQSDEAIAHSLLVAVTISEMKLQSAAMRRRMDEMEEEADESTDRIENLERKAQQMTMMQTIILMNSL